MSSSVLQPEFSDQFLTFEDALIISRQLEAFFNSPESDQILAHLAQTFGLQFKENFVVHVNSIEKNCKECMGCHAGNCILGCFMDSDPSKLCFWDEAIESVIGTKLIVHEYAHVIFDQVFENDLSDEDAFEMSEQFAQYMERNFKISPSFCLNCSSTPLHPPNLIDIEINSMMHIGDMADAFLGAIIAGIGLGIGAGTLAFIFEQLTGPEEVTIVK